MNCLTMLRTFMRFCPQTASSFFMSSYFQIASLSKINGRLLHSLSKLVTFEKMKVKILPALQDNYMYLIIDESTKIAAIVDPVEPETVMKAVNDEKVTLTSVLTTHHHWDHAGGNKKILKLLPSLEVIGGDQRIDGITKIVTDNDMIKIGNLNVKCIFTPCHTKGHICYFIKLDSEPPAVFTGDTLFTAGCGRFFEGTAEQMYAALIEKLSALPDDTRVFCGHEYTLNNLKFAISVEPDNQHILKRMESAKKQRNENLPTIPSTIGEEKLTNPFMRVHDSGIHGFVGDSNPIKAMKILREKKDNFKA